MNNNLGLIHIYTGNGKGKTTAAMGLAIRAAQNNYYVHWLSFCKPSNQEDLKALRYIKNIYVWYYGNNNEMYLTNCHYVNCNLLILDELTVAIKKGFIKEKEVIEYIKNKPKELEIVITGRWASKRLINLADYVTEMKKIKHPFDKRIIARKGIEY